MTANELKEKIAVTDDGFFKDDYDDAQAAKKRICALIDAFADKFDGAGDLRIFTVSGRTEICGNHTDHNGGLVLAGAIDRDILVIARKNNENEIRLYSEGHAGNLVKIADAADPKNFREGTSPALIAGMVNAFLRDNLTAGGFDAVMTSDVPKGSGLSSSAAFEVAIGTVLNELYNDGSASPIRIAEMAQYAENVYFGKPCGLLDQMACAVGSSVYLDFADAKRPIVESLPLPLDRAGYVLAIVNVGSSHADLSDEYAAIPNEMKAVAALLGQEKLRGIDEQMLLHNAAKIRKECGDRALLRALHFVRENRRVARIRSALQIGDLDTFFAIVSESGRSSFEYLQNVFSSKSTREQGVALALAIADGYMRNKPGAYRVHGGGFAGTVQIFLRKEDYDGLAAVMDPVFGNGATMRMRIRPQGAHEIVLPQ